MSNHHHHVQWSQLGICYCSNRGRGQGTQLVIKTWFIKRLSEESKCFSSRAPQPFLYCIFDCCISFIPISFSCLQSPKPIYQRFIGALSEVFVLSSIWCFYKCARFTSVLLGTDVSVKLTSITTGSWLDCMNLLWVEVWVAEKHVKWEFLCCCWFNLSWMHQGLVLRDLYSAGKLERESNQPELCHSDLRFHSSDQILWWPASLVLLFLYCDVPCQAH